MGSFLNILIKNPTLKIGEIAPDFILQTEKGENWRLSDQLGNVTALIFYPQNETLVCTKQMCSLRDNWTDYLETKAVIIGISPATIEDHQRFSWKHRLPLPLLADKNRAITRIFGQHRIFPVQLTRAIVVIDAKGIVRHQRIMLRAFRPTDRTVLASIYAARTDALHEKFQQILNESKEKMNMN